MLLNLKLLKKLNNMIGPELLQNTNFKIKSNKHLKYESF